MSYGRANYKSSNKFPSAELPTFLYKFIDTDCSHDCLVVKKDQLMKENHKTLTLMFGY